MQIIKGWLQDGEHQEQVFDVACSDGLSVDPQTHRCPDNGAQVSLDDCSTTASVGSTELKTLWQDPSFTPDKRHSITFAYWKTRYAVGAPGMPFAPVLLLAQTCQLPSRSAQGRRLSGKVRRLKTIILSIEIVILITKTITSIDVIIFGAGIHQHLQNIGENHRSPLKILHIEARYY